jgi:single-strand DNA-binding protein
MYQQVIIVGNVGRDAELTYTPQGIAVAKFTVAVNKRTGRGEDRKEKTTWFRVTAWRERAETIGQYVKKGMKIMVIGEIDISVYTDKAGQPAGTLELTANDFKFLDSRGEAQGEFQGARGANASSGGGDDVEDAGDIPF